MAKYIDLPNLKENLTNFLNKKINPIYAKKTEIPSNVSELNNDKNYQTAEEVGQAVTDSVAKIVAGAPEDFDTLKEKSDWISSHETSAAAMNSAISDNSVAIANHTSNSDIHVTKEEKTKWNKLDSDLKDGTIIVAEATKATQDSQGNVIDTTYAKKTEVPQGTVVDDALSSTSVNPVQNKVVKAEFDQVNSNLSDLRYVVGGKNLFKNYDHYGSYRVVDETYNGNSVIYSANHWDGAYQSDLILKKGKTYAISAYVKGSGKYYIFGSRVDNDATFNIDIAKNLNDEWTKITKVLTPGFDVNKVRFENDTTDGLYVSCFQIEEGTTATEYKPYIPSVKMLAEENAQQNDSISSLGKCKNLLNPTLQTTTQHGVTFTNNGDGTYTLNGTTTAKIYLSVGAISTVINNGKTFKLTGCPVGGSTSTYMVSITDTVNPESVATDYGTGAIKTIKKFDNKDVTYIFIIIESGVTLNNVVFKPMLTSNLSATYDDFVPYTGDGDTLTADVAKIKNDLSDLKDGTTPVAKAVADEDGNNIKSTYATKTGLDTKVNIADPVFTGSFSQNRDADSAIGMQSHAEGSGTVASGMQSHAEGSGTVASGLRSHAEGASTTASKEMSHAEGYNTTASDTCSHAEGNSTTASNNGSHAEGNSTIASNFASHASGKLNAAMTTGGTFGNTTGTAFVIGNGTSATARSNAFSVQYDGTVKAKSTITASTTADYAEFFEWLDENPNNEDRVGYFVTLDGNRIKIASDNDDYILGIVSGEPFVLGNGDCDTWNGMYLHDEFRRTIYEPAPKIEEVEIKEEREETYIDEETGEEKIRTVEVVVGHEFKEVEGEFDGTRPKLNPEYDNTQQYISRFDRKEWSPVGMLGVLAVRHDGTAKVNGYVTVNKDGIATACDRNIENSYRVIKANTDSVVEVIFK